MCKPILIQTHRSSLFARVSVSCKLFAMSEEIVAPTPPPLPPSPLEKLNDFSDGLSPMLVKELRQGLRTHSFIILFLVLQAFLALILLTTAASGSDAGDFVSGTIFSFFGLAVLTVQPLRGMSAISSEIKSDTIDLMALTKLSAWRIVFGKWCSIMGQTGLILCAIVPYLILRYFFGGMQLFAELFLLFTIFVFSGALTAITVGLSASTQGIIRLIPLLGSILLTVWILIIGFTPSEIGNLLELFAPDSSEQWLTLLGTYLIMAYLGYFFLELATTAIAPSSQNRATRKRLIGLVVIAASFFFLAPVSSEVAWVVAALLLAMITLDLFTESTDYPPIVLQPFLRFGFVSRASARFLAPGWASGFLFFLLLCGVLRLLFLLQSSGATLPSDIESFLAFLFGVLNFNILVVNLFKKRFQDRFAPYLFISALLFALIPLFAALESLSRDDDLLFFFCWIPYSFPFLENTLGNVMPWLISCTYAVANLVFAIRELRKMGRLEKEAKTLPESEPAISMPA